MDDQIFKSLGKIVLSVVKDYINDVGNGENIL